MALRRARGPLPLSPGTLTCEELICLHGWSLQHLRLWEERAGPRLPSSGVRPTRAPPPSLCVVFVVLLPFFYLLLFL